jgi:hypothetical protein
MYKLLLICNTEPGDGEDISKLVPKATSIARVLFFTFINDLSSSLLWVRITGKETLKSDMMLLCNIARAKIYNYLKRFLGLHYDLPTIFWEKEKIPKMNIATERNEVID